MNKQLSIAFLGLSLLTSISRVEAVDCTQWWSPRLTLGGLTFIVTYYALVKPEEEPAELSTEASTIERVWHAIRYDILGQDEKKDIGFKLEDNGDLTKKKIRATKLGKLYVATKHIAKVIYLPAGLAGVWTFLKHFDINPECFKTIFPAKKV